VFIGHLPAGYIFTKKLIHVVGIKKYLWLGLLGSIIPDIDLLYFYFIDDKQTLHHTYWMHVPIYWGVIATMTVLTLWISKKERYYIASLIFFSGIFLHLILDTIVGNIFWTYPFSDKGLTLIDVPAVYNFWVFNFVFHWSQLLPSK